MIRGFIEQQHSRLNEQRPRERDAHSPSPAHVAGLLLYSLRVEAEATKNGAGAALKGARVELVELLVDAVEELALGAVLDEDVVGLLLEAGDLALGRVDDVVEGGFVRRLGLRRAGGRCRCSPGVGTSLLARTCRKVLFPQPLRPMSP